MSILVDFEGKDPYSEGFSFNPRPKSSQTWVHAIIER